MICPFCKEAIQDEAIKCRYCGSFINLNAGPGFNADSITTDEIRAFIGINSHYYINQFSKFTITGREKFCATWNWSCFGFTFLWMLYRKMYFLAVITFIVFCVPGINLLMHIIAGVVGNYLYYGYVKEKILEIRALQSPQGLYPVLQEVGGVNRWVITSAIILMIILGLLFITFFASITTFIEHPTKISI